MPMAVRGGGGGGRLGFHRRLSVFLHDISKYDAARIAKCHKRSTLSPGNPLGQKVKDQGHKYQKQCRHGS